MSSSPALAIDNPVPLRPSAKTVRLGEAEKIASQRIESASITSLRAALSGAAIAKPAVPAAPGLVERIDAAAKLAAEATLAQEAVETLKRVLQAQLAQPPAAEPHPAPVVPATTGVAVMSPLATIGETRLPDIRGFLAGFVISGALGAVLYLYMMAR